MPTRGPFAHIDLSIGDPARSIPFYEVFFEALGYRRLRIAHPGFEGPRPRRAAWRVRHPNGSSFGIEVRPARPESRDRAHDRYSPGLHHLAFHAASPDDVDRIHAALVRAGARVLDPPTDYSGRAGYSEGYYAAFFADPDGLKLEVAHIPDSNP